MQLNLVFSFLGVNNNPFCVNINCYIVIINFNNPNSVPTLGSVIVVQYKSKWHLNKNIGFLTTQNIIVQLVFFTSKDSGACGINY